MFFLAEASNWIYSIQGSFFHNIHLSPHKEALVALGGHILEDVIEWFVPDAFPSRTETIYTVLSSLLIAPVLEEVLFRCVIFDGLLKKYSLKTALIVSSLLFGLLHFSPYSVIATFIMGLAYAYVYYKTQSILICILAHWLNNLFAVVLSAKPVPL